MDWNVGKMPDSTRYVIQGSGGVGPGEQRWKGRI